MKEYNIGGYRQRVTKDNIICECMWGSIHPIAWKEGTKICKHIKELIDGIKSKENKTAK